MPFQLSPGVAVVEKDFSSIVPAVSSSAGAFAGPFAWGPIEDPVRVSSESDLVMRFGAPKNENFQSFFTAANFLAYTNNMYICRADAVNLKNAVALQSSGVTGVNMVGFGSGYIAPVTADPTATPPIAGVTGETVTVTFSAPNIAGGTTATGTAQYGTVVVGGNTVRIVTGVTITNAGSGYTVAPTVTFSAPVNGGTTATGTTTISTGGVKIKNLSTYLDTFSNGTGSFGSWAAKFAGTKGNGLRVVMLDATSFAGAPDALKGMFNGPPGTSKFASDRGLLNDEVHVAVFDTSDGGFSGVPGSVLEKYSYISKISDARRSDGSNNYYKSVINSQSKYVWWMDHPTEISDWSGTNVVAAGDSITMTVTGSSATIRVGSTSTAWAAQASYKTAFDAAPDKSDWKVRVSGANASANNTVYTVTSVAPVLDSNQAIIAYHINVTATTSVTPVEINVSETDIVVKHLARLSWGQSSETYVTTDSNKLKGLVQHTDVYLSGGKDDYNSPAYTPPAVSAAYITSAYNIFSNTEQYDISLVPVGNVSASTAKNIVDALEARKDCVVFISPNLDGGPITSTGADATTAIINYRNATSINSSYAVIDSGWKYQYDRYNDAYRWVPLNGDIAGLCARTDYTADPWFSPGGFNRGQIKNIVKLGFNPAQADRDVLYVAGINPVVNFPGQGTILYGDKTMLSRPSAFDRINVRRLFIVLEKAIATAAKFQMFEFNDSFTRAQFKNLVEPFLRDVQGRRGVTDFRVKCDETNNTGEIIDRNEFIADIFIKPNRSINFITLNFVAARSSVSFEEIGG